MTEYTAQIVPFPKQEYIPNPKQWIGRLASFELITGTRVSGRILAVSEIWIDTDNGAMRIEHIVHARWVSEEEARITRGGPLENNNTYRLR
jgi:hypothetical protein